MKHIFVVSLIFAAMLGAVRANDPQQELLTMPHPPMGLYSADNCCNLSFSSQDSVLLVINKDGTVTTSDGTPIDELPPAQQIDSLCAAISSLAKGYGIDVKRCGKP